MSARSPAPPRVVLSPEGGGDDPSVSGGGFPRPVAPGAASLPPPNALSTLPVVERGRYAVEGVLAQGGIGRILRARDAHLGRPVAIKELRHDPTGPGADRFVREVRITAGLQHPSIVTVHEAGRWPTGEPFFAMTLVEGRTLAEALADRKTMRKRLRLLPHVIAAAEAMAYAHSRRVVHRDLKPANVLVGSFGETVVIDWGLAKDLGEAGAVPEPRPPAVLPTGEGLTAAGAVVGTPAYMPREQAAGEPVDERTDVYALGAILYHLIAGRPPYGERSAARVLGRVLEGPPKPLEDREPEVPADLADIVRKAMARAADDRYPSAAELAEDLRRFTAGKIVSAHEYSPLEKLGLFVRRYRAAVVVSLVGFVVTLAVVALAVGRVVAARDEAERQRRAAEDARTAAVARADDLTLAHARAAAARDPTEAVAWLRALSPTFPHWAAARVIAEDARARGIGRVLAEHTDVVNDLAFSPDSRLLATSSDDGTLRLWDVTQGTSAALRDHTDETWMLLFLPGPRTLASASKDRTIRLTDLDTRAARVLGGHEGPVSGIAASADGRLLASSGFDHSVRVWDTERGTGVRLASPDEEFRSVALSARGRWLAAGSMEGTLVLWDLDRGGSRILGRLGAAVMTLVFTPDEQALFAALGNGAVHAASPAAGPLTRIGEPIAGFTPSTYHALALSGDGRTLAFARTGGVALLDARTAEGPTLPFPEGRVTSVALSPDRRFLAAGGSSRTARVWDLATGEGKLLSGFFGPGVLVAFSPDGATLAAAGTSDTALRLYATSSGPTAARLAHPGGALALRLDGPGTLLATAGRDGAARLWELPASPGGAPPAEPVILDGHRGETTVAVSEDGATLATAGEEGSVQIWSRAGGLLRALPARAGREPLVAISADGRLVAFPAPGEGVQAVDVDTGETFSLAKATGRVSALAFSPRGDAVAFAGHAAAVHVWTPRAGAAETLLHHTARVTALAFSPDGEALASGGADHTLCVVRLRDGRLTRVPVGGGGVQQIVFSGGGEVVLWSSALEGTVRALDLRTGKDLGSLVAHEGEVVAFALSPDDARAAAAFADGHVRLWDRASGESRLLPGHAGGARDVAFAPDGRSVLSVGEDGALRVWADDLPEAPEALRAWLRAAGGPGVDGLLGKQGR